MSNYSFSYMLRAGNLEFVYVSESVSDVLDLEERDLISRTINLFFDEEEEADATRTLSEIVQNDKVACLVYLKLLHRTRGFVDCVMSQSVVNGGNLIVGSISLAEEENAGSAARDQTAQEVIMITEPEDAPPVIWGGPRRPRSAFFLDRFSANCTITHCTNAAILDPETCVDHPGGIFRYVAQRDEQTVRAFITNLKRSGIGAGNGGFSYLDFTMCTTGRDLRASSRNGTPPREDEVPVNVVGSATSDGLILIVRRND
ncbi:hypothetical protein FRC08_008898 [Ceratobasidium sp. 394]|nr:hypothetical protein FRC08_008898 [Ceratobasidium sp. 394]KAG9097695.1 hypothetical protein FS749_005730 [Ceratobasidium sp. UAMH 11750]